MATEAEFDAFLVDLARGIPAWHRDALCAEYPHVEFFVDRGEATEPAKAICARCLVRDDCLAYALTERIAHGVWGGLSERERRRLREAAETPDTRERAA